MKRIPSPIPDKRWYLRPWVIAAAGGLLPFGSIFIEMYFIFTSFWNYKVYYVYGFFLLVFLILIIVTLCVTVVGTYFLLNAENYHWHWTAFSAGASTCESRRGGAGRGAQRCAAALLKHCPSWGRVLVSADDGKGAAAKNINF